MQRRLKRRRKGINNRLGVKLFALHFLRQGKRSVSLVLHPKVPPRVEYTLTELGQSMSPILDAMAKGGAEFKEKCK